LNDLSHYKNKITVDFRPELKDSTKKITVKLDEQQNNKEKIEDWLLLVYLEENEDILLYESKCEVIL
jgi:hypothetical protein